MRMKEKIHTGELYLPNDPEILSEQQQYLEKLYDFNFTRPTETEKRQNMLTGLYLAVFKKRLVFKNIMSELPLILVSGAAMGVNWILLFESYRFTSVSIATLSYYFAPVIVNVY